MATMAANPKAANFPAPFSWLLITPPVVIGGMTPVEVAPVVVVSWVPVVDCSVPVVAV